MKWFVVIFSAAFRDSAKEIAPEILEKCQKAYFFRGCWLVGLVEWNVGLVGICPNRSSNNPVLVSAKFILSVLALAVHLALSYPERPA